MPDHLTDLDRLAAKQTKLSGDPPFKYDQSRCDLVDFNEDRRMHWWSERDDEFYAMCRNLDFSALAAHIRQVEAERDETKNRITLLEEIIRTKIATIDRLSKEKAGGHLAEKQVVEQRTEIASLHQHIEKVEAERDEARTRLAEAEAIVAKLPRTADGVPVVPGDKVWHPQHIGRNPCTITSSEGDPTEYETTIVLSYGKDNFVDRAMTVGSSECYSTRHAAEQAAAKEGR